MSAIHAAILGQVTEKRNSVARKNVETATLPVSKRAFLRDRLPIAPIQERIAYAIASDTPYRQVAAQYQLTTDVLVRVLGAQLRRGMRKTAMAVAALCGLAVGVDSIEAAMGHADEIARVVRVRSRRSRSRRDDALTVEVAAYLESGTQQYIWRTV